MPITLSLTSFQQALAQCDNLIANAHVAQSTTPSALTSRDLEQITEAAFLNMFIGWEEFVEAAIGDFMMGDATMGGTIRQLYT